MTVASARTIGWVEQGLVPDRVIRAGFRRLLQQRIDELNTGDCEYAASAMTSFVAVMDRSPVAPVPDKANEQHYELPAAFFDQVLGRHGKYSSCFWDTDGQTLDEAEVTALRTTCERAGIEDGMRVLELGCGWGSLTLWIARNFPGAQVTGVSNSHAQRRHIEAQARDAGLANVRVITADMNEFELPEQFDRVISLEMFEHMRNYRMLFERVHDWLRPGGQFFMHIFCHRSVPYEFVERDASDWMSRYFFSGGIMPSDALPLQFQEHLKLSRQWRWNGRHYERTLNAWLQRMDARKERIMPILRDTYGSEADVWWMRWRIFFMACAELFGFNNGQEWWVSHYLFERPAS